ncbi:MAG TPA: hypothetical protein PLV93_05600 [Microthrixaceae bacterium]|nr:hypothetical protein [Microthrixaceae bacterium]HNI34852.1 hypothetical protein [Microthrixaceae bacterium]
MNDLLPIVAIVAGVVVAVLAVLFVRGRFGTAHEQGRYHLTELARSKHVPRRARRRSIATGRGSTIRGKPMIGAGVLWLTDDRVGFVRRTPHQTVEIDLRTISSATSSDRFTRDGIEETANGDEQFLIVEWQPTGTTTARIAWLVPDADEWAQDIRRTRR